MMLETKRQKPPKREYTAVGVAPGDGFDVGAVWGRGKTADARDIRDSLQPKRSGELAGAATV
jgi:hypothetical protein